MAVSINQVAYSASSLLSRGCRSLAWFHQPCRDRIAACQPFADTPDPWPAV